VERTDLICGGFPCQDVSEANPRGRGLDGERSGLWSEFARVLRLLRPRFALVENVGNLRSRGLARVLGDLAALGYDAEWSRLSACSLGFPHPRERLFIVAYSHGEQSGQRGRLQFPPCSEITRDLCLWPGEPEPIRMADGVPDRLVRNSRLANAVIPQAGELLGRWLHKSTF
jgi:DNA (cytosine-5)-methyltransferase 1